MHLNICNRCNKQMTYSDQNDIGRKRGSSVVRHLPLVLEVPGSIHPWVRKISVSEHAFSSVICRYDNRKVHRPSDWDVNWMSPV